MEVNFPTSVYAGENVTLDVTSNRFYTGGKIASFIAGKVSTEHLKVNLSLSSWSTTFGVPSEIGKNYTILFSTDQCGALTRAYVIQDPANKANLAAAAAPVEPETGTGENTGGETPPAENKVADVPVEPVVEESPSLFTGLATTASGFALPVVGLLVLLGVVMVGRGYVNTNTSSSDNPMLASAARIHSLHGKPLVPSRFEPSPLHTPRWKSR